MRTRQSQSFVVRLAPGATGSDLWYGEIQHVQNGRRTRLRCLDDLVRFVEAEAGSGRVPATPTDGDAGITS